MRASLGTTLPLLLLLVLLLSPPVAAEGLQVPPYRTVELDNGLTVMLLRHPVVPMVTLEMWIDAGAAVDTPGREGLAALTAGALRKGAGDLDAKGFAEALDHLGATFESSVDPDRVRVTLDVLSKDVEAGLSLFADALLRPRLDEEEVRKLAAQMAESVAQAKDNPRNVLGDYHRAHLYGTHPYGNPVDGTESSFVEMGAGIVRDFYRDHYGADRSILAVTGDLDPDDMERRIRSLFGSMPRARAARVTIPAPPSPQGASVLLVDKSDTPQTWFQIGTLGPSYGQEDFAATELVRTIFGGRFTSWLNTRLRIENGLTYGARYNMQRWRVAGPAAISTFTATETTKQAIDLALAELDRLHEQGLSEEELASAKAYLKGQMPYDFETAADLAEAITALRFYGVGRDYLDDLFARIDAVTLEDCQQAVRRWFRRDNLVITAVGVASEVQDVLAEYGPVAVRENTDPGFR